MSLLPHIELPSHMMDILATPAEVLHPLVTAQLSMPLGLEVYSVGLDSYNFFFLLWYLISLLMIVVMLAVTFPVFPAVLYVAFGIVGGLVLGAYIISSPNWVTYYSFLGIRFIWAYCISFLVKLFRMTANWWVTNH